MFAEFETYIRALEMFSEADLSLMRSSATPKTLRRKELLLREGEVCNIKIFVSKGFLRSYGTRPDGSEHIMKFIPEHSWTTDPDSYDNNIPTRYSIEALEETDLLVWSKEDFAGLNAAVPQLKELSAKLISANIYNNQQRVFSAISATAEEKYNDFVSTYPAIFDRVPLHMVASYLGLTRETLSRIRHAQLKREQLRQV